MAWLTIVVSAGKNSEESELAQHTSNMVLKCSCILRITVAWFVFELHQKNCFLNCSFSQDFAGDHCDIPVQRCLSNPCHNAGRCVDVTNGYICQCPVEFTGSHCETKINPCDSRPCIHGTCKPTDSGYHCNCTMGYTGVVCGTKIKYCDSTVCQNEGICVDGEFHETYTNSVFSSNHFLVIH